MIDELLERLGIIRRQTWIERHSTMVLVAGAMLFMVLSLWIGMMQSVWFDEAYSVIVAKQPIDQLLHLTAIDAHPPFYYLLLKAWAMVFGWDELALRSLSALLAGGAVLMGGLLVRKLFGIRAALTTLPFLILAPFLLRYGFEIRMYALGSLIGIAATYALVAALQAQKEQRWKWYLGYGVLVALGMYSLYYTAVLWMAHVAWLLWIGREKGWIEIKQPIITLVGSALLFLPWLPVFFSQLGNGALAAISQPLTIENLSGIISFMFVYQPTWQLSAALSLVVMFVIGVLIYFGVKAFKVVSKKQKPYLILLACYIGVPIAVIALISLFRPMYVERYLAHVSIGASLFVGVVVWLGLQKASKKVWLAAVSLVVIMGLGLVHLAQVGNYNFQRHAKPDVAQVANAIGNCDKTIFAADPYIAIELSYYLPECKVYFYSDWTELTGGYAPLSKDLQIKDPSEQLARHNEITYLHYADSKLEMPSALQKTASQSFSYIQIDTLRR